MIENKHTKMIIIIVIIITIIVAFVLDSNLTHPWHWRCFTVFSYYLCLNSLKVKFYRHKEKRKNISATLKRTSTKAQLPFYVTAVTSSQVNLFI